MPPRAVFFDLDDTLLDTSAGVQASWEIACGEFAAALGSDWQAIRDAILHDMLAFWRDEAAVEHWRTRLADAREHVMAITFEARGWNPALVKPLSDRYAAEREIHLALFEDSLETLELLRSRGFKLGLLTNGPAEMQRGKVRRFDLAHHFDVVVIEGEFGKGKPHRAVFEHALATVGVPAGEAWHVGDNLYADIGGAQAAGLHATWIHRDRLELKDDVSWIPDRVIAHLPELRAALDC
jgi:putative hydrolase of the HAD superfamily